MSSGRPSTSMAICPSCGRRRSTMFMPAMILMRLMTAAPMSAGSAEHVVQRAVDPVPDADTCVLRLDVDVGGAVAHALRDDQVHDLHDGGVDTGVGFRHRPRRDRLGREERVDVTTHAGQRSVRLVDRAPDVRRWGDHRHDGQPRRSAHLVDGRGILGERHRDLEAFVGPSHRDRDVGARHRFGNQGDRVVLRRALSQVGERQVEPGRQHTREVEVVDRARVRRAARRDACRRRIAAAALRRAGSRRSAGSRSGARRASGSRLRLAPRGAAVGAAGMAQRTPSGSPVSADRSAVAAASGSSLLTRKTTFLSEHVWESSSRAGPGKVTLLGDNCPPNVRYGWLSLRVVSWMRYLRTATSFDVVAGGKRVLTAQSTGRAHSLKALHDEATCVRRSIREWRVRARIRPFAPPSSHT